MANLRQQIAESEAVRLKFLSGKPFSEADFRNVLSPDADLHKHRCVDCAERFSCCGELCADSEWALCRGCAGEREAVEMWQEAT